MTPAKGFGPSVQVHKNYMIGLIITPGWLLTRSITQILPEVIARNDNMISINGCLEVDLFGQVSSESSGSRHISGTGGQVDFLNGAYMSKNGKGFICFESSFTEKGSGEVKSRVVPSLPCGEIVTSPRSMCYHLVTEWGKVNLAGRSTWERAEMIISIAHPDYRDELIRAAESLKIWRKSNRIATRD